MDDSALLREYLENASDDAFASLVARHVNLVYSVALRQTGKPHQAEEITQAVFVILAKKASQLRSAKALSSWLFQTTRLTANNYIRSENRRHHREQEAYMQSILNESGAEVWPRIAPLLDTAVAGLREKDRQAIVLRFYEGKNLQDVGLVLGTSKDAAEKRVGRALEKLRSFFTKRGVTLSAAVLTAAISANSVQAAPVALAKAITPIALAKGTVASLSISTLVQATLIAMKTKTIIITSAVAVAVLLAAGTCLVYKTKKSPSVPAAGETLPVKFANAWPGGEIKTNASFINGPDESTLRTPASQPAGHIKSVVAPTTEGSGDYLQSIGGVPGATYGGGQTGVRQFIHEIKADSALYGKHVRITGWMKTKDVRNWAGVSMFLTDTNGATYHDDNMGDRPLHGTTDWQQVEIVTDLPKEPCLIIIRPTIYGAGEIWYDEFQMDVAPPEVPYTDDRKWHMSSPNAAEYTVTTDYEVKHNGHPTTCLAYTPDGPAPKGSWMWWGCDFHYPEKYYGHTVKYSIWMKSENVSDNARANLRPTGANFKSLTKGKSAPGHPQLHGTTDWTLCTVQCFVPKETQILAPGIYFPGSGKLWYDPDSIKYEIIK